MSGRTKKNPTSGKATWSFNDDDDTGIDSDGANQVDVMCGGNIVGAFSTTGLTIPSGDNLTLTSGDIDLVGNITLSGQVYNDQGSYRTVQGFYRSSVVSSIAGATTEGGLFALSNPFGAAVIITGLVINVGTAATSATATADFGTAAASNSSADNLIDSCVLTATGLIANDVDGQGTNGKVYQKWASDAFITGTVATGNVSGLVATVYVTAIRQ